MDRDQYASLSMSEDERNWYMQQGASSTELDTVDKISNRTANMKPEDREKYINIRAEILRRYPPPPPYPIDLGWHSSGGEN